jgi:ubiquinone/menaquinone biosynthesis C-methylase UbiE
MSQQTNLEEYHHPARYDMENEGYLSDVRYLLTWANKVTGTIIDLACGTGRATIPLAEQGHPMVGVDIHRGMLAQAKRKSTHLSVTWVEQDCKSLNLGIKSPFIYMVGNSFQHFLTNEDQDGLLKSVHHHLETDGVFLFNTRFPSREELLQPSTEEYWKSYTDPSTGKQIDVYTMSNYDSLQQIQQYTTIRRTEGEGDNYTNISLRYTYPKEMERLAESNGFQIIGVYEDWQETPLSKESQNMIYILKRK